MALKYRTVSPERLKNLQDFMGQMSAYAPDFKGPTPVDEAARTNIETWKRVSIEGGYAGAFVSQFGNKQWV